MECFIFCDKKYQEIVDSTGYNSREYHEYHIEVDCIRVDLEKKFKSEINWNESERYNSIAC